VNSSALNDPDFINRASDRFGSQCIVLAIDAKRRIDGGWDAYLNGGRVNTGRDVVRWAVEGEKRGAGEILLTSMDCDGTKNGYDIQLTRQVSEAVGIPVIASGGAGKPEDFLRVITEGKADAVLAASLFHFGELTIGDLKEYLRDNGIEMRF
jgi:cyclase